MPYAFAYLLTAIYFHKTKWLRDEVPMKEGNFSESGALLQRVGCALRIGITMDFI